MKILLTAINAKYIHSNLAVYSLYAYAKDTPADIKIAEYTINNEKSEIISQIYDEHPDVVAFSTYIWNVEYVCSIGNELKKILPDIKIWLGGPEVSYDGVNVLQRCSFADVVIVLEGEETFRELCMGKPLSEIRGIVYRDEKPIMTPPRPLLSMDSLPFPYDDLYDFENRIIYYESSRGCPFMCSYCLSSIEKSVRFRSLSLVKKELKFFIEKNVPQVKFVDRTFNCDHKRTKELWQFLIDNDNGVTNFHFEVSADLLDDEEIELIGKMREGLIQLEIGVQSTNEDTIREIRRHTNIEKLSDVVARIKTFDNTKEHLDLIAGLPYENLDSFRKSFNDVYAMNPDELQLGFLKVLKGSYMNEKAAEYGISYTDYPPFEVLKTNWISYDDIKRLKSIEDMVENYYNSGQYPNTMRYLLTFFESAYAMYDELARFYKEHSLLALKHSRIQRYNYLHDFGISIGANREVLSGILTYDLYLREKLKTRPAFSVDVTPYKDEIHSLYKTTYAGEKGKLNHIEPITVDVDTFELYDTPKLYFFDYENKRKTYNYAKVTRID